MLVYIELIIRNEFSVKFPLQFYTYTEGTGVTNQTSVNKI